MSPVAVGIPTEQSRDFAAAVTALVSTDPNPKFNIENLLRQVGTHIRAADVTTVTSTSDLIPLVFARTQEILVESERLAIECPRPLIDFMQQGPYLIANLSKPAEQQTEDTRFCQNALEQLCFAVLKCEPESLEITSSTATGSCLLTRVLSANAVAPANELHFQTRVVGVVGGIDNRGLLRSSIFVTQANFVDAEELRSKMAEAAKVELAIEATTGGPSLTIKISEVREKAPHLIFNDRNGESWLIVPQPLGLVVVAGSCNSQAVKAVSISIKEQPILVVRLISDSEDSSIIVNFNAVTECQLNLKMPAIDPAEIARVKLPYDAAAVLRKITEETAPKDRLRIALKAYQTLTPLYSGDAGLLTIIKRLSDLPNAGALIMELASGPNGIHSDNLIKIFQAAGLPCVQVAGPVLDAKLNDGTYTLAEPAHSQIVVQVGEQQLIIDPSNIACDIPGAGLSETEVDGFLAQINSADFSQSRGDLFEKIRNAMLRIPEIKLSQANTGVQGKDDIDRDRILARDQAVSKFKHYVKRLEADVNFTRQHPDYIEGVVATIYSLNEAARTIWNPFKPDKQVTETNELRGPLTSLHRTLIESTYLLLELFAQSSADFIKEHDNLPDLLNTIKDSVIACDPERTEYPKFVAEVLKYMTSENRGGRIFGNPELRYSPFLMTLTRIVWDDRVLVLANPEVLRSLWQLQQYILGIEQIGALTTMRIVDSMLPFSRELLGAKQTSEFLRTFARLFVRRLVEQSEYFYQAVHHPGIFRAVVMLGFATDLFEVRPDNGRLIFKRRAAEIMATRVLEKLGISSSDEVLETLEPLPSDVIGQVYGPHAQSIVERLRGEIASTIATRDRYATAGKPADNSPPIKHFSNEACIIRHFYRAGLIGDDLLSSVEPLDQAIRKRADMDTTVQRRIPEALRLALAPKKALPANLRNIVANIDVKQHLSPEVLAYIQQRGADFDSGYKTIIDRMKHDLGFQTSITMQLLDLSLGSRERVINAYYHSTQEPLPAPDSVGAERQLIERVLSSRIDSHPPRWQFILGAYSSDVEPAKISSLVSCVLQQGRMQSLIMRGGRHLQAGRIVNFEKLDTRHEAQPGEVVSSSLFDHKASARTDKTMVRDLKPTAKPSISQDNNNCQLIIDLELLTRDTSSGITLDSSSLLKMQQVLTQHSKTDIALFFRGEQIMQLQFQREKKISNEFANDKLLPSESQRMASVLKDILANAQQVVLLRNAELAVSHTRSLYHGTNVFLELQYTPASITPSSTVILVAPKNYAAAAKHLANVYPQAFIST